MRRAVVVVAIALLCAAASRAQQPPPNNPLPKQPGAPETKQGAMDQEFLTGTWLDSMAEVELGTLTQQRGSNDQVKQFGQRMITDHTKAGDELKAIAAREQVTLPTQLDGVHAALKKTLEGLKGAEYDRRYIDEMAKNHRLAVNSFDQEAKNGSDAALKAFASKNLPTIREHLKMAEDIVRAISPNKKP